VANAVLDGVDGFLLGQETLRGTFPIEAVQTIMLISKQAEKVFDHHYHFDHLMDTAHEVEDWVPPGTTPPGAASPAEGSSDDLAGMGGEQSHLNNSVAQPHAANGALSFPALLRLLLWAPTRVADTPCSLQPTHAHNPSSQPPRYTIITTGMVRNHSSESFSSLTLAVKAMTRFGPSSRIGLDGMTHSDSTQKLYHGAFV